MRVLHVLIFSLLGGSGVDAVHSNYGDHSSTRLCGAAEGSGNGTGAPLSGREAEVALAREQKRKMTDEELEEEEEERAEQEKLREEERREAVEEERCAAMGGASHASPNGRTPLGTYVGPLANDPSAFQTDTQDVEFAKELMRHHPALPYEAALMWSRNIRRVDEATCSSGDGRTSFTQKLGGRKRKEDTRANAPRLPLSPGLKVASCFAGCGGAAYGLKRGGHVLSWFSEKDPVLRSHLRLKFPDAMVVGDISDVKQLPCGIGILEGGFPCEDVATCGNRKGDDETTRTGLYRHILRLLKDAIDNGRPVEWVILENVLGCAHLIDSTSDTVLDHVIMDLNLIGYRVAYRRIRLQDLGLPQLRTRVVILASRTQNPMDVLLAPGGCVSSLDGEDATCVAACGGMCFDCHASRDHADAETAFSFDSAQCWATTGRIDALATLTKGARPTVVLANGTTGNLPLAQAEIAAGLPVNFTEGLPESLRWTAIANCCAHQITESLGLAIRQPSEMKYNTAEDTLINLSEPRPHAGYSFPIANEAEFAANFYGVRTGQRPFAMRRFTTLQELCGGGVGGDIKPTQVREFCAQAVNRHNNQIDWRCLQRLYAAGILDEFTPSVDPSRLGPGTMDIGRPVWARRNVLTDDNRLVIAWWPCTLGSQMLPSRDWTFMNKSSPQLTVMDAYDDSSWEINYNSDLWLSDGTQLAPPECACKEIQARREASLAAMRAPPAPMTQAARSSAAPRQHGDATKPRCGQCLGCKPEPPKVTRAGLRSANKSKEAQPLADCVLWPAVDEALRGRLGAMLALRPLNKQKLGRLVRIHWQEYHRWFTCRLLAYNPATGVHTVRYTDNTEGEYKLWFHHVELVGADGDEPNETVSGDVIAAPPLAPHTLNDTYSVYTHMTVEEASRAGVTVCGEERVVKRRKYGPYTIAQLWERWGVRGKHLTVWDLWRKFKVKPDNGEGNFTLGELMDDYSSSRKYNRRPHR